MTSPRSKLSRHHDLYKMSAEKKAKRFVVPRKMSTKWDFVLIHGPVLPEHDRYNLEFLYSSRITCFCICPVILYCFLCALHFVEMLSSRPTHFVEKDSVPLRFVGARPLQGNFKGNNSKFLGSWAVSKHATVFRHGFHAKKEEERLIALAVALESRESVCDLRKSWNPCFEIPGFLMCFVVIVCSLPLDYWISVATISFQRLVPL